MELLTVMVVVRDRHTEGGMMITNHDHHTTVTKHRFPRLPLTDRTPVRGALPAGG